MKIKILLLLIVNLCITNATPIQAEVFFDVDGKLSFEGKAISAVSCVGIAALGYATYTAWQHYYTPQNDSKKIEQEKTNNFELQKIIGCLTTAIISSFVSATLAYQTLKNGRNSKLVTEEAFQIFYPDTRSKHMAGSNSHAKTIIYLLQGRLAHQEEILQQEHNILIDGSNAQEKILFMQNLGWYINRPVVLLNKNLFDSPDHIKQLFKQIHRLGPCLISIDNIDEMIDQQMKDPIKQENLKLFFEYIDQLDKQKKPVLIVGTTSHKNFSQDTTILLSNRFIKKYTLDERLNFQERISFFTTLTEDEKTNLNIPLLARLTEYESKFILQKFVQKAREAAQKNATTKISMNHFDDAYDLLVRGDAQGEHRSLSTLTQAAYHEASHALVGVYHRKTNRIHKITLTAHGKSGGCIQSLSLSESTTWNTQDYENAIIVNLAGGIGEQFIEKKWFDTIDAALQDFYNRHSVTMDVETAHHNARQIILARQPENTQLNEEAIAEQIQPIIKNCYLHALETLTDHRPQMEQIATKLVTDRTIPGSIAYEICKKPIPLYDFEAQKEPII